MEENIYVTDEHVRAFNLTELPAVAQIFIALASIIILGILLLLRGEWGHVRNAAHVEVLRTRVFKASETQERAAAEAYQNALYAHKRKRRSLTTRWLLVALLPAFAWIGVFAGFHSFVKPLALQSHIYETYLVNVDFDEARLLAGFETLTVRHPVEGEMNVRLAPYENRPSFGFVLIDEDGVMLPQTHHDTIS